MIHSPAVCARPTCLVLKEPPVGCLPAVGGDDGFSTFLLGGFFLPPFVGLSCAGFFLRFVDPGLAPVCSCLLGLAFLEDDELREDEDGGW